MADTYSILSQSPGTEPNPAGTGFMDVWNITYKVTSGPAKGTTATLQVPEEDHNAAYVDQAIQDKIQTLGDIAGLGGS